MFSGRAGWRRGAERSAATRFLDFMRAGRIAADEEIARIRGLSRRHGSGSSGARACVVSTTRELAMARPGLSAAEPARRSGKEAQFPGAGYSFGAVSGADLAQHVGDVLLDGVEGDEQFFRDGLVWPACGEQPQDLQLASG
jgi:hypothetical protein